MLQVLPVLSKANRISSQYSRRRSKIPQDVFGLATTLVLFYGLDDLALIESTCFHYPKNQKLYLSLFQSSGGNTYPIFILEQILIEIRQISHTSGHGLYLILNMTFP